MADRRLRELERGSRVGNDADKAAWVTHLLRNCDAECSACAGQGYTEEHGTATLFGDTRGPNGEDQVPCVARAPCRPCGTTGLRLRGWLELAAWCWSPWAVAAIRAFPAPAYGRKCPRDIDGQPELFREWARGFFQWDPRASAAAMVAVASAVLPHYSCPHTVRNPPGHHYCGGFLRSLIKKADQWAHDPSDDNFRNWTTTGRRMPGEAIDWLPQPAWLSAHQQRNLGVWLPRMGLSLPTVEQRLSAGAHIVGYDEAHRAICSKLAVFAEEQLRRG